MTKEIIIIIHGTWAKRTHQSSWYKTEGYFFNTVQEHAAKKNAHVISFGWSGRNSHHHRHTDAKLLVKLIQSYDSDTTFTIIGHSHGATVGILASHLLAQDPHNKHAIKLFFALGAPINPELHPQMSVIHFFYNFYSYDDFIQPVFGMFDREIVSDCQRIANIRLIINDQSPSHTDLHHRCVARWICYLHDILSERDDFMFEKAAVIHLYDDKPPLYLPDQERDQLRELERNNPLFSLLHPFKKRYNFVLQKDFLKNLYNKYTKR